MTRAHRSVWIGVVLAALTALPNARPLDLPSPNASLAAHITVAPDGRLTWSLRRAADALIEPSPLGLRVEGTDFGTGVALGPPETSQVSDPYPWRGVKSRATNDARLYRIPVRHAATGTTWTLEARVFDDGFAWRYRLPGAGTRRVQGEASGWTLPDKSRAWFQTNTGDYEGVYEQRAADDLPQEITTDRGPRRAFLGPPITVELPTGGYLLISEANLVRYSGMTLRPEGRRRLAAAFEDDPEGFLVDGEIVSPWRVTVAAPDLNALVNTDVIHNLADPPDPKLFPEGVQADWLRPGRALITWCVFGNDGAQWPLQKWFVDQCAALHCEYLLVDAGWRSERWGWLAGGGDVWARLKELCDYGQRRGVGIVVWHSFPEGRDDGPGLTRRESRLELFQRCRDAGVRGVKIDFFNSERKEVIDAYQDLARLAAEHRLLINFHGANKPTGEVRTWPNEITREGIREQEYLLWDSLPLPHYAALPFTRMVVGHADFLPTYVRKKYLKNTTAVFQMATAVIATTSFLCWPDHPDDYLGSPFLGLVQALPLVWDETRVLPGSAIGESVAFARRADSDWFVGALHSGAADRTWTIPLTFLGDGRFDATLYRDQAPSPEGVGVEVGREVRSTNTLELKLAAGGGFVAWIRPAVRPPGS